MHYLSLFALVSCFHWSFQQGPEVETTYGWVRGQTLEDTSGKTFDEFLGIPFAAPPVGSLRWQKPAPAKAWEGIREATQFSPHCTHFIAPFYPLFGLAGGDHDEDCLYLNVWVPRGVEEASSLPVMVYYYGGAFILGTGEMYPGWKLALHGDVIVVNFNYRVSTLGWLASGDGVLPGNYGLWDARAALQWVQDNIANFGGNPDAVTIFGESAGGSMVSHSVISPQFEGLFHRAIAISGGATSFFGLTRQARGNFLMMSDIFNCNTTVSQEILDCLMQFNAPMLDFWGIVGEVLIRERLPSFVPVVDGEMIVGEPTELYEQGFGKDIDFMSGALYHDGAGFIILNPIALPFLGDKNNLAATPERLDFFLETLFNFVKNRDEMVQMAFDMYPDMITDDNMTRTLAATDFGTDWWFKAPSYYETAQHARNAAELGGGSTFHYVFRYAHSFLTGYPDWMEGSHLDDMYSVLGDIFMSQYRQFFLRAPWRLQDYAVSNTWMSYLTNFATTGNPNTGIHEVPVQWPNFEGSQNLVMSASPYVNVIPEEDQTHYNFLAAEFPFYGQPPESTKFKGEELISRVSQLKEFFAQHVDQTILEKLNEIIDEFMQRGIHK